MEEGITNTVERQKAQFIYDTYFNPDSELVLDFNLFDTLEMYGVIDEIESSKLDKKFEKIGENLWEAMKEYDKKQLR